MFRGPRIGKGIGISTRGGGGVSAEYQAVLAAMEEQPSDADQKLYDDNLVKPLKTAGIWQELDLLRIYGNANNVGDAAFLNWINPTANKGTPSNAFYTFTAKEGIQLASSTWFVNGNWKPVTHGVNFKRDDASMGVYSFTNSEDGSFDLGTADGNNTLVFSAQYNGNYYLKFNDNEATTPNVANDNSQGFYVATRNGATRKIYKNGNEVYSQELASAGISDTDLYEFAYNNGGTKSPTSTRKLGVLFYGGHLTPEQVTAFTTIVNDFFFSMNSVNASTYGFDTEADATTNTAALQAAVDDGFKEVVIDAGTYELNDTILLDSHTRIKGIGSVTLKKSVNYCSVFLNRGATTEVYNDSIYLENLTIDTNNKKEQPTLVFGLRANIGFYKIRNLYLNDINIISVDSTMFSIYIVDFEKVRVDNLYCEGPKDGINFGPGNDAIISNSSFKTGDDASALAGIGFSSACVQVGDISNITYQNCIDYTDTNIDGGYFCRAMVASWEAWGVGKQYQQGDICVNEGNLYQVNNELGFTVESSADAPVHTSGDVTGLTDGITWRYKHAATVNNYVTISNITFENVTKYKKRPILAADLYYGVSLRSGYPGTENNPKITGVIINNCNYDPQTEGAAYFIRNEGVLDDVKITNTTIVRSTYVIYCRNNNSEMSVDRNVDVEILNSVLNGAGGYFRGQINALNIYCYGSGNSVDLSKILYRGEVGETSTFRINDDTLLLSSGRQEYLSPEIGDRCLTTDGIYEYTAEGWELQ